MIDYHVRMSGGIGTRDHEYTAQFLSDVRAISFMKSSFDRYHPVYTELVMWRYEEGNKDLIFVARLRSKVTVQVDLPDTQYDNDE